MITHDERRWVLRATVLALVLANLPMVIGFIAAPQGTVYTGIDSTAPGDINVYLSYLQQVRHGHFVYQDLLTAEPQANTIINGFWLGLGLLGSLLGLSPLFTYFAARIVLGFLLLLLLYRFAAWFFTDVKVRRAAFLLAVYAGGVGAWAAPFIDAWYHGNIPGPAWPMDLWVSEAFTFLSLHHSPHFIAATMLILGSVGLLARTMERRSTKDAALAGTAMLLLYSFHPFHVLSLGMTTAGFSVVALVRERRRAVATIGRFALAWAIASPAIVYQAWLTLHDPFGAARAQQNILLTTWPGVTVMSYGFLLAAAMAGAITLGRRRPALRTTLLITWAVSHAAAIYLPVFFNRRVTQGLNVALAMLAAPVVVAAVQVIQRRGVKRVTSDVFAVIMVAAAFGMSTIWVSAQDLSFLLGSPARGRPPYYFYLNDSYRDAFAWLASSTNEQDVVLSAAITGNFIPGWSGRHVVIGHNVETVHFDAKQQLVGRFFDGSTTPGDRRRILQETRATYVVIGPWERRIGVFDGNDPTLVPVFSRGDVRLYRVVPSST